MESIRALRADAEGGEFTGAVGDFFHRLQSGERGLRELQGAVGVAGELLDLSAFGLEGEDAAYARGVVLGLENALTGRNLIL